ncbi:MAG TPA: WGxxGxxG family protein [Allosphingosinicella sp.]|nr:WGxxGxxG family protein [Allosphingosinicella sp.]
MGKVKRAAWIGVGIAALAWAGPPAAAQTAPGADVPTETQQRLAEGQDDGFDWNWIGLVGLFGLAGLHRRPDYHDSI